MLDATSEEREEAHQNLRRFAKALLAIAIREAREDLDQLDARTDRAKVPNSLASPYVTGQDRNDAVTGP
jgi:F0F1-type ATP synthase delta subunit